jgi:hypothetical protein
MVCYLSDVASRKEAWRRQRWNRRKCRIERTSIMLIPCQYKLLNGDTNTADVDGVDFFGNRPTTRDYGYLSTDNASTAATISALGTNSLGALPLNNTYYSGAPVSSILVECMVLPSSSAITYSWHRSYRDCSAMIVHSGSNWNVTTANSTSNPSQQSDDTGTSSVFTTSVSAKQLLYYADCPGANLAAFFNACQVGDFAYLQRNFTYTLTITIGTTTTTSVLHVGQVDIVKRIAVTGNPLTDWQVQQNTVTTTAIPTCQVTRPQVNAIVGTTTTGTIDPAVNENLYQE